MRVERVIDRFIVDGDKGLRKGTDGPTSYSSGIGLNHRRNGLIVNENELWVVDSIAAIETAMRRLYFFVRHHISAS